MIMTDVTKAIIPAAGLGTRFYPITKCIPKEMLPIINKPVIHYVIQEAISSGIHNIGIITSKGKSIIEEYIDMIGFDADIVYLRQRKQKGLGDAIYTGKNFIGKEPFAVLLGDDIIVNYTQFTKPAIKILIDDYNKHHNPILHTEEVVDRKKYGIMELEGEVSLYPRRVLKIIEKPEPWETLSNWGVVGRYVLTPDIFPILSKTKPDKRGEIQLTSAINKLMTKRDVYAVKLVVGKRLDIGTPEGYMHAINYFFHQL
jgi:UTP--glucose-1-phosphate uridylyltransferase